MPTSSFFGTGAGVVGTGGLVLVLVEDVGFCVVVVVVVVVVMLVGVMMVVVLSVMVVQEEMVIVVLVIGIRRLTVVVVKFCGSGCGRSTTPSPVPVQQKHNLKICQN